MSDRPHIASDPDGVDRRETGGLDG